MGSSGLVGSHVSPDSPQVGAVGGDPQQLHHFQSGSGLNDQSVAFHPSDTLMGLPADLPTTSRDPSDHVTNGSNQSQQQQQQQQQQTNLKSEQ